MEKRYYGEYGPFREDVDGLPVFADVVRYFLGAKGWSKKQLGYLYGKATLREPYTERWIQMQLKHNSFSTDPKRRWILAKMLDIPPLLLGIATLDDLLGPQVDTLPVTKSKHLDIEEYRSKLSFYWQDHYKVPSSDFLKEITTRISVLCGTYLYVNALQQKQIIRLLFDYHQIAARTLSNIQRPSSAIAHLNKSYTLAQLMKDDELQALAIFRRGYIFFEKGDRVNALCDFDTSCTFSNRISLPLNCSIELAIGHARAHVAQSEQDMKQALLSIDNAEKVLGRCANEDEHFMQLNEVTYHQDRAEALLGSPLKKLRSPNKALRELDFAAERIDNATPRRSAWNNVLLAKAYLDKEYYPIATSLAHDALGIFQHSAWHIRHISKIYEELKRSSYGNSVEVAELWVDIVNA